MTYLCCAKITNNLDKKQGIHLAIYVKTTSSNLFNSNLNQ